MFANMVCFVRIKATSANFPEASKNTNLAEFRSKIPVEKLVNIQGPFQFTDTSP